MCLFSGGRTKVQDYEKSIEKFQQEIRRHKFNEILNVSDDVISDLTKLKKRTNSAHFRSFAELLQKLPSDARTATLQRLGFRAYNLGSQMAHSHFEMTMHYYNRLRAYPLYSEIDLLQLIGFLWQLAIDDPAVAPQYIKSQNKLKRCFARLFERQISV